MQVKPSLILDAGNGVFVTKNVQQEGQNLGYFHGYEKDLDSSLNYFEQQYSIKCKGKYVVGYLVPKDKEFGVGQLINDGSKPDILPYVDELVTLNQVEKVKWLIIKFVAYYCESIEKANVAWKLYYPTSHKKQETPSPELPHGILFCNTKAIMKNQECYISYGLSHWFRYFEHYFETSEKMEIKKLSSSLFSAKCWLLSKLTDIVYEIRQQPSKYQHILDQFTENNKHVYIDKSQGFLYHIFKNLYNNLQTPGKMNMIRHFHQDWKEKEQEYSNRDKSKEFFCWVMCQEAAIPIANELLSSFT